MEFYGREEEQKQINYILSKNDFASGIVYGRRRLGKTELLKHCFYNSNKTFIIYQCNQENEKSNINDLVKIIKETLGIKNLFFETFVDAIEFLFEYAKNNELCFAIDEYPYIRKIISGLDSKLQRIIDNYQNESKIKFFLLGSSISIMESILSESNPLYRRFNVSILLKEMDYYDSAKFYKDFSNEDKVKLYAAFGGVPFYNKQIDSRLTVKENIINLLDQIHDEMYNKALNHLKEHTTECDQYDEMKNILDEKGGFVLAPWCGKTECELKIKEDMAATSRCIASYDTNKKCICCGEEATKEVLFARSY